MKPVEAKIAELAARFAARAPEECAALAAALTAEDCSEVVARAHKLAGIAGMLGYPAISDAALDLEEAALGATDCGPAGDRLLALLEAL